MQHSLTSPRITKEAIKIGKRTEVVVLGDKAIAIRRIIKSLRKKLENIT